MGSAPTLPYPGWGEDTVTVPANYFKEGRLPAVCVVTGAPATSNLRRRFGTTPGWVGCLFFVSWFALLIALVAVATWIVIIPVALIPALAPAANPLGLALAGAGLVALVGSAVASSLESATLGIQGRVVENGFGARWVQLRGVHSAFSRALAARLGR